MKISDKAYNELIADRDYWRMIAASYQQRAEEMVKAARAEVIDELIDELINGFPTNPTYIRDDYLKWLEGKKV